MPRAMKTINIGDRFGSWTVKAAAEAKKFPSGQYQKQFSCQCDCGNSNLVTYSALTRGKSSSCGCAKERDYTGQLFGRYIVLRKTDDMSGRTAKLYAVKCITCNTERKLTFSQMQRGSQKPCTCQLTRREFAILGGTTHGKYGTPEHISWQGMIARCINPKHPSYKNYGGRGIRVAEEWQGVRGFQAFFEHVGVRPEAHSLDRIDPHGNYEPGNVRWATKDLQEANKRPVLELTEVPGVYRSRKHAGFYVRVGSKRQALLLHLLASELPDITSLRRLGMSTEEVAIELGQLAWRSICGVG